MLTSQCILKSTMSAESKHFHCQFSYAIKIVIDINHVILIIHPQGRANWIKMSIFWSLSDPIMCQIELLTIRLCSKIPSQIKYVGLIHSCRMLSNIKVTHCPQAHRMLDSDNNEERHLFHMVSSPCFWRSLNLVLMGEEMNVSCTAIEKCLGSTCTNNQSILTWNLAKLV